MARHERPLTPQASIRRGHIVSEFFGSKRFWRRSGERVAEVRRGRQRAPRRQHRRRGPRAEPRTALPADDGARIGATRARRRRAHPRPVPLRRGPRPGAARASPPRQERVPHASPEGKGKAREAHIAEPAEDTSFLECPHCSARFFFSGLEDPPRIRLSYTAEDRALRDERRRRCSTLLSGALALKRQEDIAPRIALAFL